MAGRLADSLLYLSNDVFKNQDFEIPSSTRELAELSGMTRDNVVRVLKNFRNSGIIDKTGDLINIIDYKALKDISIEDLA